MATSDPRFWGPQTWRFLHAVSFTFPDNPNAETRKAYADFYDSLTNVLPCPACRYHLKQFIKANPIDTTSRKDLARWVWKAHDNVNVGANKKSPSFEKVTLAYTRPADSAIYNMKPDQQQDYLQNQYLNKVLDEESGVKKENEMVSSPAPAKKGYVALDIAILVFVIILLCMAAYKLYLDYN